MNLCENCAKPLVRRHNEGSRSDSPGQLAARRNCDKFCGSASRARTVRIQAAAKKVRLSIDSTVEMLPVWKGNPGPRNLGVMWR